MFIIEGADHLGKTTLAHKVVDEAVRQGIPAFYSHMGRPPEGFDWLNHYRLRMQTYAVQDRFHLGSLIWHEGVMNQAKLRLIEGWLYSQASFILVMTGERNWYLSWLDTDNRDQLFDRDKIKDANTIYTFMALKTVDIQFCRPTIDTHYQIRSEDGFPDDEQISDWVEQWRFRLELLV